MCLVLCSSIGDVVGVVQSNNSRLRLLLECVAELEQKIKSTGRNKSRKGQEEHRRQQREVDALYHEEARKGRQLMTPVYHGKERIGKVILISAD